MGKQKQNLYLPDHEPRNYQPVGECIYCGSVSNLTKEHIIPFFAGGRWVLPEASCKKCAAITGKFEGEVARTIVGPLRMLYDLPSRRKKERPKTLPLKVKYPTSADWETVEVERDICPFLVGLPIYPLPDAVTGNLRKGNVSASTSKLWLRGAGFWRNKDEHLEWLCQQLGAIAVMPTATVHAEPFCLMLAKIAHSFAVAELGLGSFDPFLTNMIVNRDTSKCQQFIGGGKGDEQQSSNLHDLQIDRRIGFSREIVVVRVRILGILETPTYHVAVGRSRE
jgi:hypothetical protein